MTQADVPLMANVYSVASCQPGGSEAPRRPRALPITAYSINPSWVRRATWS